MIIVKDTHNHERCALSYIHNKTSIRISSEQELDERLIYYPFAYPCLVEFYITLSGGKEYVSAIECNKKTAKSIVYPRTNVCKDNQWYKLNTAFEYNIVAKQLEVKYMCRAISHVDTAEIAAASAKKEPFLIRGVPCHGGKALKMFLLKKEKAKRLVYHKQNIEREKKKFHINNIERLVRTYREEDDIQFYNPEN